MEKVVSPTMLLKIRRFGENSKEEKRLFKLRLSGFALGKREMRRKEPITRVA